MHPFHLFQTMGPLGSNELACSLLQGCQYICQSSSLGLGPMYYSCSTLILLVHHTYYSPYCRHCILYLLRLDPLFPIVVQILKPKVGLGPDQIEIDLRKMFPKNYNSFMNQISYFWKIKGHGNPRVCVCACMLKICVRLFNACICKHGHMYACQGSKNYERQVFLH